MRILKVPIEKVEPWEKNPRGIKTDDFERLKRQILKLGVYKPLVCFRENGKYITLGGNMRIRALKELGVREVEISIVRAETEAEKIEYALSDNDRAGYYEEQALAELLYPHLAKLNLDDFRIDVGNPLDLRTILEQFGPDLDEKADEIPEIDDSPAITKPGELFRLGRHRLLCGDSTNKKIFARLLNDEEKFTVITDPPYGIDIVKGKGTIGFGGKLGFVGAGGIVPANRYRKIEGDQQPFSPDWLLELCDRLIIFGGNYFASKLPERSHWIVWDKRENIASNNFADCELAWTSLEGPARIYRHKWSGLIRAGSREEELTNRAHPTQKPVGLFRKIITDHTEERACVVDPYLGSGTTLIAAEATGRRCYGAEIEPKYCDVIIKRYADYAGIPEEKIRKTAR